MIKMEVESFCLRAPQLAVAGFRWRRRSTERMMAMAERSGDWYRQARRDLDSARAQRAAEFFEWACFISQQASEKALKAALQKLGGEAWGHSIADGRQPGRLLHR